MFAHKIFQHPLEGNPWELLDYLLADYMHPQRMHYGALFVEENHKRIESVNKLKLAWRSVCQTISEGESLGVIKRPFYRAYLELKLLMADKELLADCVDERSLRLIILAYFFTLEEAVQLEEAGKLIDMQDFFYNFSSQRDGLNSLSMDQIRENYRRSALSFVRNNGYNVDDVSTVVVHELYRIFDLEKILTEEKYPGYLFQRKDSVRIFYFSGIKDKNSDVENWCSLYQQSFNDNDIVILPLLHVGDDAGSLSTIVIHHGRVFEIEPRNQLVQLFYTSDTAELIKRKLGERYRVNYIFLNEQSIANRADSGAHHINHAILLATLPSAVFSSGGMLLAELKKTNLAARRQDEKILLDCLYHKTSLVIYEAVKKIERKRRVNAVNDALTNVKKYLMSSVDNVFYEVAVSLEEQLSKCLQSFERYIQFPISIVPLSMLMHTIYIEIKNKKDPLRVLIEKELVNMLDCEQEYNNIFEQLINRFVSPAARVEVLLKNKLQQAMVTLSTNQIAVQKQKCEKLKMHESFLNQKDENVFGLLFGKASGIANIVAAPAKAGCRHLF